MATDLESAKLFERGDYIWQEVVLKKSLELVTSMNSTTSSCRKKGQRNFVILRTSRTEYNEKVCLQTFFC